jgi:glycerophosphoryl diester phosphodiesterase/HEAT repeat protein
MHRRFAMMLYLLTATIAPAAELQPGGVELLCHRTANEDVPENTLESLEQAALLGCNVVEIDLRRTLDGKIVLNHDGLLERLTDGVGDAEKSYYGDLELSDAGVWMGERFAGMRIPLFQDALRVAREQDVRLILDIKTKGIGVDVLELLQREGMLERVQFGGEWSDIKQLYPAANQGNDLTEWVQPGVTAEQVKEYHHQGKAVIANFSANKHEMDLAGMTAAVAAGVDGINVDYPRLGADAVGRPVERKLNALALKANSGESKSRAEAILELSRYSGFPLQSKFAQWLLDPDGHVSRAAALALVMARPRTPVEVFAAALHSPQTDARANAAWALGELQAPASTLLPLLQDKDPRVLQAALMALARMPGEVGADSLVSLLAHSDSGVRGAAAPALARHQPDLAVIAVPKQLGIEIKAERVNYDDYVRRGKPTLTPAEIAEIMGDFRCQMKMVQAISSLKGEGAMKDLEEQAFREGADFSQFNGIVAAFDLWDRIGADPHTAVQALASGDVDVGDRAEWMLVKAGPVVLPEVRTALGSESAAVRERAIRIVAWQGDAGALETLRVMQKTDPTNAVLAAWAVDKIESLHPQL